MLQFIRESPLGLDERFDAGRGVADEGTNAVPKILARTTAPIGADGPENRWVIDPRGLRGMRALLHGQLLVSDNGESAIMRSHGISPAALEALRDGDEQAFLMMRRATLLKKEAQFVEGLGLVYRET